MLGFYGGNGLHNSYQCKKMSQMLNNKLPDIMEHIIDQKSDIIFLIET